ncbi:MAG TPA: (Fe-S)-binding protein [Rectinemataceae bacterium]|nr:(Fe-S)-binding protein [Rectinemataceae bacterium]
MALKDFRPMEERCSNCLGCKWIPFDKVKSQRYGENCPSISWGNFNTYSARGRFELGLALLTKDADLSPTTTDIIHACTSCGACDVACKVSRYNLEPLDHNIELKAYAVEQGKLLPGQAEIIESLKKEKTMIRGRKKAARGAWAEGLGLKDLTKEKAEVLFFPGCKSSYDEKYVKNAKASVRILKKAGVDLGYLGAADMCCAGRALQMGFKDAFDASAAANIKAIEASGAKIIVTPCSDCYHAFKRQYPKLGLKVEVLHVVEYMDRLIKEGKLAFTKKVPMRVTYHDPCHLGRLGEPFVAWEGKEKKIFNQIHTWEPRRPRFNGAYGIYDAPRDVIASIPGVELVEMERIREYSWCCGAGSVCDETNPEFSSWTAAERVTEANSTGAGALVTACPWCESNFRGTKDENGRTIEVLDIVELVEMAL